MSLENDSKYNEYVNIEASMTYELWLLEVEYTEKRLKLLKKIIKNNDKIMKYA